MNPVIRSTYREAILYAFVVEANHDRGTLERYLKEYPYLADDLVDLTTELRFFEAFGPSPAEVADPRGEAAWQEFIKTKRSNDR
jgi:hypothetical protein